MDETTTQQEATQTTPSLTPPIQQKIHSKVLYSFIGILLLILIGLGLYLFTTKTSKSSPQITATITTQPLLQNTVKDKLLRRRPGKHIQIINITFLYLSF